jgi:hypothetical protein
MERLNPDPWRERVGFTAEIENATRKILDEPVTAVATLQAWLTQHQPCLFGRIAARLNLMEYCLLRHEDLMRPDDEIQKKIQLARTNWTRHAFDGSRSGFLILATSPTLSNALPDHTLKTLAQRICSLYLLTEVSADHIYLDDIFLEKPGPSRTTWRWRAGVNFFGAQGDRRWWADHRIPGGIALSVNSVGHMVKAGQVGRAMRELNARLSLPSDEWAASNLDSLDGALALAMRTISQAALTMSGRATALMPIESLPDDAPSCPVDLPDPLAQANYCQYRGYYHTDITIPSEYFEAEVARPDSIRSRMLDFTYLFDKRVTNPDYVTMAEGQPIRADAIQAASRPSSLSKRLKAEPETVSIDENARLKSILAKRRERQGGGDKLL